MNDPRFLERLLVSLARVAVLGLSLWIVLAFLGRAIHEVHAVAEALP